MYRILIIDDSITIRALLERSLTDTGYHVFTTETGTAGLKLAQECKPHLIILDLGLPDADGLQVCRQLRSNIETVTVPILLLSARDGVPDKLEGFDVGADDYITKPFSSKEVVARVRVHLQRMNINPLTLLPGNRAIESELENRLRQALPFAFLYIDLNHFKPFNDLYGFTRGDLMILLVSRLLKETVQQLGSTDDFIGHIGGDDFVVLTTPERARLMADSFLQNFSEQVPYLYDTEHREQGQITIKDRRGHIQHFSLMTAAIGVVTNEHRRFVSYHQVGEIAAEVKHKAKAVEGNAVYFDKRER